MKSWNLLVTVLILTSALFTQNAFADRNATPQERAKVVEALSAQGCPNVGEVELDGKYFEAEDVICDDGLKYEIFLDQEMNIIKKKLDD
ncbi:MAG: PepSY domain-containing protein [Deltaproteobacteria bacterium]|nr:PepSY domain-containing protein [Deltaproteobacteria bacterium]MCK5709079.1 PepSY domain-containing protein [Deltaproteobacteria bacterium]